MIVKPTLEECQAIAKPGQYIMRNTLSHRETCDRWAVMTELERLVSPLHWQTYKRRKPA